MGRADGDPSSDAFSLEAFRLDPASDEWLAILRESQATPDERWLGSHRDLIEIGRGGQGIVYRAWDVRRERHVALKRLIGGAFASDGARARLARELEAARALAHPNIVVAHGLEHAGSQPILVMEWIEGRPITRWARSPECGHERVLRAFVKICGALEHAHRRGVV